MENYFYKNLYEILGITPDANEKEIKSAYRAMARKYHPDLNKGDEIFAKKFKEITAAYEVLNDKDKKKLYDTFKGYDKPKVNYKKTQQTTSSTTRAQADKEYKKAKEQNASFSDVFNNILEGLFEDKTKSQSSTTQNRKKRETKKKQIKNGTDITLDITLNYEEALKGTNRTVNIMHTEICPNCQGKMFINESKCPLCGGSGETSIHKKINVKIPKNIKQNAKIRIANEGNRGQNGGKNGDVYLIVKIENNSKYKYDGLNVFYELPIQPHEAVLGAEIPISTPQGNLSIKIPAKTNNGQKFRLSAHGLKNDEGKYGDFVVIVKIDVPKNISEEELELYEKLAKISKENIRISEEYNTKGT